MKKRRFLTLLVIFLITFTGYTQRGFNYKALISGDGNALTNQSVTLRFTVLEEGTTVVYQETHSATTDDNGIVSVQVGEGSIVNGDFSAIDWSKTQFLKVEIDTGDGYDDFGTSALQYVPYAKYADQAGNAFSGNYADLTGKPDYSLWDTVAADDFSGDYNDLNNKPDFTGWDSNVNDDFSGNYSDLSGKPDFSAWDTVAADDFSGDYNDLSNIPSVFTLEGSSTPATQSAENIQHTGSLLIGDSISSAGAGKSSLRINRKTDDNNESFGLVSVVDGSGSGYHYGSYNLLTGDGTGNQYGTRNLIKGTVSGSRYGVENVLECEGTQDNIGVYNLLTGNGSGKQYGTYNRMIRSTNSFGYHYGNYTYISSEGTSSSIATYNKLDGGGSGTKYGSYNYIPSSAGGTHYAVYGNATKAGSYAGYFIGDAYVSQKLKSAVSGDADMKAYIYGMILTSGAIVADASSSGFTLYKVATGRYRITFSQSPGAYTRYTVMASFNGGIRGFITIVKYTDYFEVQTYDTSEILADANFDFVVYKK